MVVEVLWQAMNAEENKRNNVKTERLHSHFYVQSNLIYTDGLQKVSILMTHMCKGHMYNKVSVLNFKCLTCTRFEPPFVSRDVSDAVKKRKRKHWLTL